MSIAMDHVTRADSTLLSSLPFPLVMPPSAGTIAQAAQLQAAQLQAGQVVVPAQRAWRDSRTHQLLERLMRLSETLIGELALDRAFDAVLSVVQEVTGASRISLQLLDPTGDELTLEAGFGLPAAARLGQARPSREGVAGWVLAHREPLLVVGSDHPDPEVRKMLRATPDQSSLCVPLIAKGEAIGVLSATKFDALAPFDEVDLRFLSILAGQAAIAIAHARLHEHALQVVAATVDARDPYTAGHSRRVAEYAATLTRMLGYDDAFCQQVRLGALFHDIGKIGVPDAVLRKAGPLTDEEYHEMQQHPVVGADQVLVGAPFLKPQLPAIRHHHERWDGRGYPHKLGGTDIPVAARILSIADAYDAMTSNRVYRNAMPVEKVLGIFAGGAGTQWDPAMTTVWLDYLRDTAANESQPAELVEAR